MAAHIWLLLWIGIGSNIDRNVIGHGWKMDRILIGRGKGKGIHIAIWRHARLLAANRVELIGYVFILTCSQRCGSCSTHKGQAEASVASRSPISSDSLWVVAWNRLLGVEFRGAVPWAVHVDRGLDERGWPWSVTVR